MNICNRVANKLSYKYEELNGELRASDVVNGDETGSNQNGRSEWLWGFLTPLIAFFRFFRSAAEKSLKKCSENVLKAK